MNAIPLSKPLEIACTPVEVEVLRGLTSRPKTLSPWLFYDPEGSRLFEAITRLPEYYLTRTERKILAAHAGEMVALAAEDRQLSILELGAGTATKTGLLLQAAIRMQGHVTYHAIDVSETALDEAKARLEAELPGVTVEPRVADYTTEFHLRNGFKSGHDHGRRLILSIGSSIGNFAPSEAIALLLRVRSQLVPGDGLLLGVDLVKDRQLLLAAYNDTAGVTEQFNKNVLLRINRELEANFDTRTFCHKAIWNAQQSRVEMHLESLTAQQVSIASLGLDIPFARGETIHTENSYKFTEEHVVSLLNQTGFVVRDQWSDASDWFGVYLAAAQ